MARWKSGRLLGDEQVILGQVRACEEMMELRLESIRQFYDNGKAE